MIVVNLRLKKIISLQDDKAFLAKKKAEEKALKEAASKAAKGPLGMYI